ncbi:OfxX fusion product [Ruegeria lacuscaerulensis]|uniref:OfxX fusion product n=1 Tax=Ruegeria lacuscaerulensis TaxID=55218 RepID=UPI00147A9A91|nr:OfxX fusion product [Ruegeria lacuscaerulensis]
MRVKLKGEITAERLAEALQKASEKLESVNAGTKIYGANLYLTPFDAEGLPFDLVDHHGKPLCITIAAKSGELVKPALTAEGEQRRDKLKEEAKRRAEEEEEQYREHRAKLRQEDIERKKKCAQAKAEFESANEITTQLLKAMPEHFVSELNKTIQTVWDDLSPTEPHGKNKGLPKPRPAFRFQDDELLLTSPTWKHPKRLRNPVGTLDYNTLKPVWNHTAWLETVRRIAVVLEELSDGISQP